MQILIQIFKYLVQTSLKLNLANFCHNFTAVVHLLTDLLSPNAGYQGTDEYQQALEVPNQSSAMHPCLLCLICLICLTL